MFTGLIEEQAEVVALTKWESGWRLQLTNPFRDEEIVLGDSVSVNGCCLTVSDCSSEMLCFDLLEETLRRTNFSEVKISAIVNLERALQIGARLGGHFVQGHIDGILPVLKTEYVGPDLHLIFALELKYAALLVEKGSIALNGVSLTIGHVSDTSFDVWIIPHTRSKTNLDLLRKGNLVNVEYDILAKYVQRGIAKRGIGEEEKGRINETSSDK